MIIQLYWPDPYLTPSILATEASLCPWWRQIPDPLTLAGIRSIYVHVLHQICTYAYAKPKAGLADQIQKADLRFLMLPQEVRRIITLISTIPDRTSKRPFISYSIDSDCTQYKRNKNPKANRIESWSCYSYRVYNRNRPTNDSKALLQVYIQRSSPVYGVLCTYS